MRFGRVDGIFDICCLAVGICGPGVDCDGLSGATFSFSVVLLDLELLAMLFVMCRSRQECLLRIEHFGPARGRL